MYLRNPGVYSLCTFWFSRQQQSVPTRYRGETAYYVRTRCQDLDYQEGHVAESRLLPKDEPVQFTIGRRGVKKLALGSAAPTTQVPVPVPMVPGHAPYGHGRGSTSAHGAAAAAAAARDRDMYGGARIHQRPLPSLPNLSEQSSEEDVGRAMAQAQVHRTSSGRESQYPQYNPRQVSRPAHSTGSSSRDDPQYFVLDPDELRVEDASAEERRAARAANMQAQEEGSGRSPSQRGASGSSCQGAVANYNASQGSRSSRSPGQTPVKVRGAPLDGSTNNNNSQTDGGGGGGGGGRTRKDQQKSPEEENAENLNKEVHLNNSCHEIPLRPTREGSQSQPADNSNSTSNSSWP